MYYHILLKKVQGQIQIIKVQHPLYPKPDKSDLKQQPYIDSIEPLFTFKHNQQIKDGKSST
jgi:hypothetical protein